MRIEAVSSPLGRVIVAHANEVVAAIAFEDGWPALAARLGLGQGVNHAATSDVARRLARYFEGDLDALTGVAIAPRGTPFQERVWRALVRIPAGGTIAYSALAEEVGAPGASRAVGTANARNPIGIVVPCHRVIRKAGELGGYAGGLDRKRWLLAHEARANARQQPDGVAAHVAPLPLGGTQHTAPAHA